MNDPVQLIEEEAVNVFFGGEEGLKTRVQHFQRALEYHSKTVDVPAPTEHPVVELIVRKFGGRFKVVPTPKPEPEPEPEVIKEEVPPPPSPPTLDELKTELMEQVRSLRDNRIASGVDYKGHRFSGSPDAVQAMMATLMATEDQPNVLVRWKDKNWKYIELERMDFVVIIKLVRKLTQECFDNEYRLNQLIEKATSKARLNKVDPYSGWPE